MNVTTLHLIEARKDSDCSTCGQRVVPLNMIYLHGKGYGYQKGNASHQGCIWDDRTGPAPHLTWEQVENLPRAIRSRKRNRELPADDPQVVRLLGAIDQIKGKRAQTLYRGDHDAAIELGPDLLDGYRKIIRARGVGSDPIWHPVQGNGQRWSATTETEERPRWTPEELKARQNERIHESMMQRAMREKHMFRAAGH